MHCKPSASCSASDGETQPPAAPWFFYNDAIVQQAWAACSASSCPLIELPCGHSHYSGTYTPAKYDVAISCESMGVQCVLGLALRSASSSSLSRLLQLSLTPSNPWVQVAGNSSCGAVHTQLRCGGNARLWLRGGMYSGQENAWVGVASFRCLSCDSAVGSWTPPEENKPKQAFPAPDNEIKTDVQNKSLAYPPSAQYPSIINADSLGLGSDADDYEFVGPCLPLSACLSVGQTAASMLLAISTACMEDDCQRYLLISTHNSKTPVASHIFSFTSVQRVVLERHVHELQFFMRSGPPLKLKLPISSCSFSQYLLLELQQHMVLIDGVASAALNNTCTSRAFLYLHEDSVCVRAGNALASHDITTAARHMAATWHDHILHLQIVSGSHVSQEDAEAAQLKLQMQARASLCANETQCDITCLSCDGAFIATTPSRIAVAKLPIDRPVHAYLLSHVSSVETLEDGVVRLFFVRDESLDRDASHVSFNLLVLKLLPFLRMHLRLPWLAEITTIPLKNLSPCSQVDLPLQLCSQDEADQFLPTIIAAFERRRTDPSSVELDHEQLTEQHHVSHTNALTSLSDYWVQQRVLWPHLLHSFVGLPCSDGAIALASQHNDTGVALVHRVFSSHLLK